jgi:TolA-binding protein
LTLCGLGPYLRLTIHPPWAIAAVVALQGCATEAVNRAELGELAASLRALRAENSRIEARLERLEQLDRGAARAAAAAPMAPARDAADALPPLTVVKLKPRVQAAPRVETQVPVQEPPQGLVGELRPQAARGDDAAELLEAQGAYDRGLDALRTGNAEGGIGQLLQFVSDWPRHPRADNALHAVGLALIARQDFTGASQQFERVLAVYPAGDAVVEAMLKLAECRLALKQPQLARIAWERVVTSFPGTPAATLASARLQSLSAPVSRSTP